jgi:hypothetical protein
MPEIGKISGQLLADDLARDGWNLSFDSDLLYLDVRNRRIGAKNTGPTEAFLVSGDIKTTDLLVDTRADIADTAWYSNTIQNATGGLVLTATGLNPIVYATGWRTGSEASPQLDVRSNNITNLVSGQDINLLPTGTGKVIVNSSVDIFGNLHATGNITFTGDSITIGDNDSDSVDFKADIASNIRPDVTETNSLGTSNNRWLNLYTKNITAPTINAGPNLYEGTINLGLRQGKSWYVSVNGNDTNDGNHQSGPFLTITRALLAAQANDTIFIFPGTYTEVTPMTIPSGVSVKGLDIRTVIIQPTSGTRNKDIFLLNGETTVEDLTIQNFEYDNVNNTGYAFKFANNMTVVSRSPYIRNVTILTYGSSVRLATNLPEDPRGYLAGDAGRAAYIDGSVVNSESKEATMLFHSLTCICPGTETVVMTNGVRVEWLNSFTYFAEKGLYATQGTLGFASLGVKFGAELRSINSANVYGDWAAYGNGANVIMYLVGHNFAYVGTEYRAINDPTDADEGRQAQRLNGAQIYYQSVDQSGNVRVGNVFKVVGDTGNIVFTGTNFQLNNGSIEFFSGSSTTYIDKLEIDTGNIFISGNQIDTFSGNLELSPTSGIVNLSSVSSFITPIGNTASELSILGGIRYNTSVSNYEGYTASGFKGFYGLLDSTRTTKITPELTPGAGDKTIRMYANNDLKISITDTKTTFKDLTIGDLAFSTSQLTVNNSQDLTLTPTGTGQVYFSNVTPYTDTIEDITTDAVFNFSQTGSGFFKLDTPAVGFPSGDNNDQPLVPEIGMHRYNTEVPQFELWNGTAWVPATGTDVVSEDDMREYTNFWSLILG